MHFVIALREITLFSDIHQIDILSLCDGVCQETQRIARLCGMKLRQVIFHLHVGVERVVFRLNNT